MKRRKFLKKNVILAAAPFVTSGLLARSFSNRMISERPFKLNYAPHFGMFKNNAGSDLLDQIQFMHDQGFRSLEDNGMKFFATPRRLGVKILNVPEKSSNQKKLIKLMPAKIGFDEQKNATQALIKKLHSMETS